MKILLSLAALLLMFACTAEDAEEARDTVGQQIADDYNAAMDKARNVEDEVLQQKQKMDDALAEAEDALKDP